MRRSRQPSGGGGIDGGAAEAETGALALPAAPGADPEGLACCADGAEAEAGGPPPAA